MHRIMGNNIVGAKDFTYIKFVYVHVYKWNDML